MKEKRVLVTGGAGFIGSHLCRRLLEMDWHVICADNLCSGDMKNLSGLMDKPGFAFCHHDITLPFEVNVDQIYNLACPASPKQYQQAPIDTMKTCTIGVWNMLELARKNNARILQASTSEVYGDPLLHPQTEDYNGNVNPIGPRACYDEGKRAAEALFFDFYRQYKTKIRVARIFNTYGPHMRPDDGRVVSNFIVQALRGEDITIYGDGAQTRSFCYVDDLIDGLIALMNYGDPSFTGPVNLGNPCELTVKELALKIISLTGALSRLVYEALPADDPVKRKPSIALATRALGWQPKINIDEGLHETIRYFQVQGANHET